MFLFTVIAKVFSCKQSQLYVMSHILSTASIVIISKFIKSRVIVIIVIVSLNIYEIVKQKGNVSPYGVGKTTALLSASFCYFAGGN